MFLGVPLDEDVAAVDRVVEEKSIPWPQIADGKGPRGELAQAFGVTGYPFFYLLDRAGRIAGRYERAEALDEALAEVLATPEDGPPRELRDTWQRSGKVMDLLGLGDGSVVADVGSGEGYFSIRLARRVGPSGRVYAVDIDEKALGRLRERVAREKLENVEAVRGEEDDPRLPAESLDAVLIVDAYHELRSYDAMLRRIFEALEPGGRLGVLDTSDRLGRSRAEYEEAHRLPAEILIEDAARHGFRLTFFDARFVVRRGRPGMYYAIFEKPTTELRNEDERLGAPRGVFSGKSSLSSCGAPSARAVSEGAKGEMSEPASGG